jgi:hypothetical protein
VTAGSASQLAGASRRLGRAATFAFGATIALTGCGGATNGQPDVPTGVDVPSDEGGIIALYGGPPPDVLHMDAVDDDGAILAMYGAPPFDSGVIDATGDAQQDAPTDDGGPFALYGAPPRPDSG